MLNILLHVVFTLSINACDWLCVCSD